MIPRLEGVCVLDHSQHANCDESCLFKHDPPSPTRLLCWPPPLKRSKGITEAQQLLQRHSPAPLKNMARGQVIRRRSVIGMAFPSLIHKFTYRRTNHAHIHVRAYKEKGQHQYAVLTRNPQSGRPVQPGDRCHRSRSPTASCRCTSQGMAQGQIIESIHYAYTEGLDRPEIRNWRWPFAQ